MEHFRRKYMGFLPAREFRLAGSRGDGRHPYVNADGAFIGTGVPLLQKDGRGRWQPRPAPVLKSLLGIGYGAPIHIGGRMAKLEAVARALNDDDIGRASIALVRAEFAPLPDAEHAASMAKADGGNNYNPAEPRNDRGRWIAAAGEDTILADAQKNGGWLAPKDVAHGNERQCVSLVRHAIPELGRASTWQEGEKIAPTGDPSSFIGDLKPGTAIATFRNGRYNSTKADHAAIFIGEGYENGVRGIHVVDQWDGENGRAQPSFYPYSGGSKKFHVGDFSTIARPRGG